ncbi:MAG: hypothetical protein ACI4JX_06955, partial [Oscillospiraceae bacterium]
MKLAKKLISVVVSAAMVMAMSVALVTSSSAASTVLFTGSAELGNWSTDYSCDAASVPGAAAGGALVVTAT